MNKKQTLKCCGNCGFFELEDIDGDGWCMLAQDETTSDWDDCEDWVEQTIVGFSTY